MQPEISSLIKMFGELDDDCKDALIASWNEKDPIKYKILRDIYFEKDKERERVLDEISRLCPTK